MVLLQFAVADRIADQGAGTVWFPLASLSIFAAILFVAPRSRPIRGLAAAGFAARSAAAWIMALAACVAVAVGFDLWPPAEMGFAGTVAATGAAIILFCSVVFAVLEHRWRRNGQLQTMVAIVGLGPLCRRALLDIARRDDRELKVIGIYSDDDGGQRAGYCFGKRICGDIDDLVLHASERRVDAVIVATPDTAERRLRSILGRLRRFSADVYVQESKPLSPSDVEALAEPFDGLALRLVEKRPMAAGTILFKSVFDRVFAAGVLVAIAPLLAGIAILIKLDSPGPVIFRQKRYGLNNRLIEVFKFRTLYVHAADPTAGQLVSRNDSRVTRIGAVLRRTSLDELPQFFNVLRGDMSLVGPRPHATGAKAGVLLYDEIVPDYGARHRIKPGITGWAQVNGWRGTTDTDEQVIQRVRHDFFYIANWSLILDIRILIRTVVGGFGGRHAY